MSVPAPPVAWAFDLIVTLTTLSLVTWLGVAYTLWLYTGISLLSLIFIYRYVPETKGKSLEEIERLFDSN